MPTAGVIHPRVNKAVPWVVLLVAVAVATGLAHLPLFNGMRFPVFILIISLIGRQYGFRYALITTALSAGVIDYYFLPPIHSLWIDSETAFRMLCAFVLIALVIGWLIAPRTSDASGADRRRLLYPLPFVQSLERSAQCLEALLANSNRVAAFTVDGDGRITHWSLGAEEFTGFSAQTVLGKALAEVSSPAADVQQGVAFLRGAICDEGSAELPLVLRRADLTHSTIRARVFPLWQAATLRAPVEPTDIEQLVELGGYMILLNTEA